MAGTLQGIPSIYDPACPRQTPDVSTRARAAAVKLEDSIRSNSRETGAFIAANGSVVIQKTGSPNQVQFSGSELNGTARTLFTHNHPGDGTFSYPDLLCAIESDLEELRAVGPYLRHMMIAPSGWPTDIILSSALLNAIPVAIKKVAYMVASGSLEQRYAQSEVEHQLWVEVGRVLNLEYKRERS
jgi:hypothetical protein